MSNLISSIESLRKKLHFLILEKELTDDEVVICSQELDKLLARYQKICYFYLQVPVQGRL